MGQQDETAASATGWHGHVRSVALHAEEHIPTVEREKYTFKNHIQYIYMCLII